MPAVTPILSSMTRTTMGGGGTNMGGLFVEGES